MGVSLMAGKLDDISYKLGQLSADLENVALSIEANRTLADSRHADNQARLTTIEQTLAPLASAVSVMKPIVDGYQVTRWKAVGAIGLASVLLGFLGWALSLIIGKALAFILSMIAFKSGSGS